MPRGTERSSLSLVGTLAASALMSSAGHSPGPEGVIDAVEEYARAWFEGDEEGMANCLHPDLTTRLIQAGPGLANAGPVQALARLQGIHACLGARIPPEQRRCEITVLDISGRAASARAVLGHWVAYVHLALAEGRLGPIDERAITQRGERWQELASPFSFVDVPYLREMRMTQDG